MAETVQAHLPVNDGHNPSASIWQWNKYQKMLIHVPVYMWEIQHVPKLAKGVYPLLFSKRISLTK